MKITMRLSALGLATAAALFVPRVALAGPPLLCFPFEIGQARSLPWNAAGSWERGDPRYDRRHLVADTVALLTTDTPVVVRMETLRRATLYAAQDAEQAGALLRELQVRSQQPGQPEMRALALLDVAYVAEALEQARAISRGSAVKVDVDGLALMAEALRLRPNDPQLDYAAAIMSRHGLRAPETREHLRRALAGSSADPLLARTIEAQRALWGDLQGLRAEAAAR